MRSLDIDDEKPGRRAAWYARMVQLYPDLAELDPRRPLKAVRKEEVDPLLWEDAPFALDANLVEAAKKLSIWERRAEAAPQGPDQESKWERELLWSQVSRYRAEQRHWRDYLQRFSAHLKAHPEVADRPVPPRQYHGKSAKGEKR